MEEERRKRTRRTTLDQLQEERNSVLERIESESESEEGETSGSDHSDEDFEYSDDQYFSYAGIQSSGLDFSDDEYDDEDYQELIALGEMVGVENTGLPEAEINKHLQPFTCHSTTNLIIDRRKVDSGRGKDHLVEEDQKVNLVGLFEKQADVLMLGQLIRWNGTKMLAELTAHHSLAWDVGTGNGQAALGVAEHYKQVIATDVSESQLKFAMQHPRIRYLHTPLSMSDDELVNLIGTEGSVDLITVAQAVHWFDLPRFYSVASRLLRKPTGVVRMLRSWSAVQTAKEQGVDLLSEDAVKELEAAWGGANVVRCVVYKGFMLAGKLKL
ncbi:UNVERIFIED_CONTAM: putative methyltransferase DDB [Sesamum calycinum]|uniref:Methyltransferase DDB n=1 Tax=Sesamum calycinum TaxID=2727403 RepID=A0AAW2MNF3_9LAMI